MDRKSECEKIVLTKSEKKLLRYISRHPHTKCSQRKIEPLYIMDLVQPDTNGVDALNSPVRLDTYCVSDFYHVYMGYLAERRFDLMLKSIWLPIMVSILTNLSTDGIQWLLPLIREWFSNSL